MGRTHKKKHRHKVTCKICGRPIGDRSRKNAHKGCVEDRRGQKGEPR